MASTAGCHKILAFSSCHDLIRYNSYWISYRALCHQKLDPSTDCRGRGRKRARHASMDIWQHHQHILLCSVSTQHIPNTRKARITASSIIPSLWTRNRDTTIAGIQAEQNACRQGDAWPHHHVLRLAGHPVLYRSTYSVYVTNRSIRSCFARSTTATTTSQKLHSSRCQHNAWSRAVCKARGDDGTMSNVAHFSTTAHSPGKPSVPDGKSVRLLGLLARVWRHLRATPNISKPTCK